MGNYPGMFLMGSNCPDSSCPGRNESGVIIRDDKIPVGNCPGGTFIEGNCLGAVVQGRNFRIPKFITNWFKRKEKEKDQ